MNVADVKSLLLYYGRSELFHTMQKKALDGLASFPSNVTFRYYNGIALLLGNRIQESIRELNPLKREREFAVAAVSALIFAHKNFDLIDTHAVIALEDSLNYLYENATIDDLYNAGVFSLLAKNFEEAREFAQKALKIDSRHDYSLVLKAWADMFITGTGVSGNLIYELEEIHNRDKNIEFTLVLVHCYELRGQYKQAITLLNHLSVSYSSLNIPYILKMESYFTAFEWDQAFDMALHIINLDPTCISALRIKSLLLIIRDGNIKGGISTLQQLLVATERVETGNSKLLLQICRLFACVSSRNADILALVIRFTNKVVHSNPRKAEYVVELGKQYLLLGNTEEALLCFQDTLKIECNNMQALCGTVLCQLFEKELAYNSQNTFDALIKQEYSHDVAKYMFLVKSMIATTSHESIEYLTRAIEANMRSLDNVIFGPYYILQLDPEYLLCVITELLRHCPIQIEPKKPFRLMQDDLHVTIKQCMSILNVVLKFCPAHIQAIFSKAKLHFICNESNVSCSLLYRIINNFDSTYIDAYLLLSEIQLQQGQCEKALQSLDLALSQSFALRDNPKYYLLLGMGQRQNKQYGEAQKSFVAAMKLIDKEKKTVESLMYDKRLVRYNMVNVFTLADKVTLYLEIIKTYKVVGDAHSIYESERLMQIAMEEFKNTNEEGRLVIAHAEFSLQNSDVNKAIDLLTVLQSRQTYYIQAKTMLANIFLQYKTDRVAFAKCFKDIVENCPAADSYIMLGEAYMSIQEPTLAIEAYHKALQTKVDDCILASKLGRAFVRTHQYSKAISFYNDVLKFPSFSNLNINLAELHMKLRNYNEAAIVLAEKTTGSKSDVFNLEGIQLRNKRLLLLARVYERAGNNEQATATLQQAKDHLYILHERAPKHNTENSQELLRPLPKICLQMAQLYMNTHSIEKALNCLNECLKYVPNDIEVLFSLGCIYLQINSMDQCEAVFLQILQIDSSNKAATLMMADLSFRKMDLNNATFHFSQLLIGKPCYWTALGRLIEVMRRSGNLNHALIFLQRAERTSPNSELCPGLNYCRGLYEWYIENPNNALRHFNKARRDNEWGCNAILNMIEICINPDDEIVNENDISELCDGEDPDARVIALKTADRLLKELRSRSKSVNEDTNYQLLHNFIKLASKKRILIESALQDLTEMSNREELKNRVGPILGVAMAFILIKQSQKAKYHLKRLSRMSWNFEEAEYFERGWILLADIYIKANKFDISLSLTERVLQYNKSSTKAFELAGYISEKSQQFSESTKHYVNAWNCCGKSKPHIGYKLAYNFMKNKNFADAVDICHEVLKLHPDYTIIRIEILDKCRNGIRI